MLNSSHARRLAYVMGEALLNDMQCNASSGDQQPVDWSLYGGRAGTLLFLLEHSRAFPEERLRRQLNDLMDEIPTYYPDVPSSQDVAGLHYGVTGLAVLCARAGWILQRADLSHRAREMALWAAEQPCEAVEWGNGLAGILFGASYVRRGVACERLDTAIDRLQGQLLRRACRWPSAGVVFELKAHEVYPVCGFSHGTSGVAYALLASTDLRFSEKVLTVVNAAADYDAWLMARFGRWPDLRRPAEDPATVTELEQAYLQGDEAPFLPVFSPSDSWCNGSTGLGFLRCALLGRGLRAQARNELAAAVRSTRRWLPKRYEACLEDFTLCHALGGSCTFLMEVAHRTGRPAARSAAARLLAPALSRMDDERAAKVVSELGPGLYKGAAGVAWVLLQLCGLTSSCPLSLDARSNASVATRSSRARGLPHQPASTDPDVSAQETHLKQPLVRSLALFAIHRRVQRRAARALLALNDDQLLASTLYPDPGERWHGSSVTRFSGLANSGAPLVETLQRSDVLARLCCVFRDGCSVAEAIDQMMVSIEGTAQEIIPKLLGLIRRLLSAGHLNAVRSPLALLED